MTASGAKRQLAILGAGPFAEEIADLAASTGQFEPIAFIEGIDRERCGQSLSGLPVVWIGDAGHLAGRCEAVCAVGSTQRDAFVQQALGAGFRFTTIVHPTACLFASATLGEGSIVSAAAVIAAQARLGRHVIVNRGCLIGHHTQIGDFATISPGANIAGRVRIGNRAYVGMASVIVDGVSIGSGAVVGAGSVVLRDVPERVQVLGVPARAIKSVQ
jgi:sugar O-acyltransferase (sialic acid O-acetyltransferase NeuD family)